MNLSAHQTLLPGADLSERFQRAAECGLDGIELAFGRTARVYDLHTEIDKAMSASGLPVGSICGTYEGPIIHPGRPCGPRPPAMSDEGFGRHNMSPLFT